jgi:hypothetical protein
MPSLPSSCQNNPTAGSNRSSPSNESFDEVRKQIDGEGTVAGELITLQNRLREPTAIQARVSSAAKTKT